MLISVLYGIFPAIKTTLPYSPIARANDKPNPVSKAGFNSGNITLKNNFILEAPSTFAASSYCPSKFSRTGWTVLTTKGIPTKS